MSRKVLAAGILAAAVGVWWFGGSSKPAPAPTPAPSLNLRGMFVGPDAAADAMALGCLLDETASVIAWDAGLEGGPRLKTAAAFDDLRRHAREGRMRGESIGQRQPRARDAIAAHMVAKLGTSGGPVNDAQRNEWVFTLREIGEACRDAAR